MKIEDEVGVTNVFDYFLQHTKVGEQLVNNSNVTILNFSIPNVDCTNILCKSDWKNLTPLDVQCVEVYPTIMKIRDQNYAILDDLRDEHLLLLQIDFQWNCTLN
jgi:hypothetical protein